MSINKVMLLGNLCKDPDFRRTSNGKSVCDIVVASNRNSGGKVKTCFITVTAWGKLADNCSRYLKKGSGIFVEGHFVQDLWQDRETGKNMEKIKVEAEDIQFMPRSRAADSPDPRPYAPQDPYSYSQDYDDSYPEPQPDGPVGGGGYVPFYGAPPEPAQRGVDPSISEEY